MGELLNTGSWGRKPPIVERIFEINRTTSHEKNALKGLCREKLYTKYWVRDSLLCYGRIGVLLSPFLEESSRGTF